MTRLLALDIASKTGVVFGEAGQMPTITSWRLRRPGQSAELSAANFACMLRDLFSVENFDMVVVESYLNPIAQPSADAAIFSLLLRGALEAVAGCYAIPVKEVAAGTARSHFCGQATAVPPRKRGSPPRTAKQKAEDRLATKMMVWKQAVAVGYFSRGDTPDLDRSDAVAVYDYAIATFCRVQRPFALFGSTP